MRKSTLFISAVLTTFVLAMLAGVASAYQNVIKEQEQKAAQVPQPLVQPIVNNAPTAIPAPLDAALVNITPEEAADLAAQVMGRDDLFSVEITDLNGDTVYLVTFSSGDLVYISLDGQILSIGKLEVETVVVSSGGRTGGNNNGNSSRDHDDDHDDDDHEEHEEHDD